MSLEAKLVAFAQAVGVDIGELITTRGDLSTLTTTAKENLVSAINELKAGLGSVDLTAIIDDAAGVGVVDKTWSADKIVASLETLKQEILNGAPEAFNTLKEIADYLAANTVEINSLLDLLAGTVRVDVDQGLTDTQKDQACANIGVGDNDVLVRDIYLIARDTNTYIDPGFVEPGYVG